MVTMEPAAATEANRKELIVPDTTEASGQAGPAGEAGTTAAS
jgi:hypothetical protein